VLSFHSDTADGHLNAALELTFGRVCYEARKLLSDQLESVQRDHEKLLLSWNPVVNEMMALGIVDRGTLPIEWFVLVEFLTQYSGNTSTEVDLLLEEVVLDEQDDDGESVNDDVDSSAGAEHLPPEDDECELGNQQQLANLGEVVG
jgi:hypothetical protein